MSNGHNLLNQFVRSEEGATTVEYAVMLVLIIVACVGGVTTFGSSASATFDYDAQAVAKVTGASAP